MFLLAYGIICFWVIELSQISVLFLFGYQLVSGLVLHFALVKGITFCIFYIYLKVYFDFEFD